MPEDVPLAGGRGCDGAAGALLWQVAEENATLADMTEAVTTFGERAIINRCVHLVLCCLHIDSVHIAECRSKLNRWQWVFVNLSEQM